MTRVEAPFGLAAGSKLRWRPYQIYLLLILVLVSTSSYMDRTVMILLQEGIKRDLSLSDWQVGLLSGPAFVLFYSFVGLPVARIAERSDRGRLLAVSVVVWSGMTALCSAAGNFISLGLCRMGVGMGEGGCNPVSHALVADNFTVGQRGFAMAVFSAAAPIAAILSPLLVGYVTLLWGWRAAFLAVGLPGLILALAVLLTIRDPRVLGGAKLATFTQDLGWLLRNRAFVLVFVAGALNGVGVQGTLLFTTSYVMRTFHLNVAQAGEVLSLRGLMGLLGTVIGGYLADRFADPRGRSYLLLPAFGAALSFLLFTSAFAWVNWPFSIVCLMGGNLASELKNGPNFAAVQNLVPTRMRATAAAVFFLAATVVGTGVGGALVGALSDVFGAHAFSAGFGSYASSCAGGHASAHAAGPIVAACAAAASTGLRTALLTVSAVFLGAMTFFWLASRTAEINRD